VAAEAARGLTLTAAAPSGEASNCQSTMAGEASGGGVASSRRVAA
jgi:predicted Na+-dependent transporter